MISSVILQRGWGNNFDGEINNGLYSFIDLIDLE